MSDHIPSLADLRREIDVLDDQIQDLLRRRAEAVQRVAASKEAGGEPGGFLRPGREAQVLRRVLERHRNGLVPAALLRIWREMIAALYPLQTPVRVAVHAPNKSVARWDIARDFYGSTTPMQLCTTAMAVMRAISSPPLLTLGVMAMPEDGEKEPWWPMLASHSAEAPKVIAKLPFVPNPEGSFADLGALVIGLVAPEASGDDRTLLVLVLAEEAFSLARLSAMLAQAGFEGRPLAQHRGSDGMIRSLVEVDGFVATGDARLTELAAAAGDANADAIVIGAYPVPVQ